MIRCTDFNFPYVNDRLSRRKDSLLCERSRQDVEINYLVAPASEADLEDRTCLILFVDCDPAHQV